MGHYVHIHVCFECTENEPVAKLAAKHLASRASNQEEDDCVEAWRFLDDLSRRTGHNPGRKGGLSTWGQVGNYTDVDLFVSTLEGFWRDVLTRDDHPDDSPKDWSEDDHVLVFVEHEQTHLAHAYEIGLDGEKLVVKKHKCPFSWNQM